MCDPSPSFMIAPAPNVFSIWPMALFKAFCSADTADFPSVVPCRLATAIAPSVIPIGYVRKNSNIAIYPVVGQAKGFDFPPTRGSAAHGLVARPVSSGPGSEADDFGCDEIAARPGAISFHDGGRVARVAPIKLESAQGYVGVKTVIGGIACFARGARDCLLDLLEKRWVGRREPGPEDSWAAGRGKGSQALEMQLARLESGDARGHKIVEAGRVGIRHVAQECERHMKGSAVPGKAAAGQLGPRIRCMRLSSRSSSSGISIAKNVRVLSLIDRQDPRAASGRWSPTSASGAAH